MSNILKIAGAGVSAAAEETDENFNQTVLLLHGDGNQGATNFSNAGPPVYLAFKDNSSNNFPITVNGDAYGDNFGPYAVPDGNWSNYFDGTGDYLNTSSTLISTTATTFTIEAWIYMTAAPVSTSNIPGLCGDMEGGAGTNYMSFGPLANGKLGFQWFNGGNITAIGDTTMALNTWNHIAVVVNSSAISLYVNGITQSITGTTTITNRGGTTSKFTIGVNSTQAGFTGYASNIRVTNTAVYTSVFTPSTTPLTAVSGTSLLTCQSNRFVDNSSNNFTITRNGDVKVQVFNPFGELPDGVNGSGYFDGSGDRLTIADNAALEPGSSDITFEAWVYVTATPPAGGAVIAAKSVSGAYGPFNFQVTSSRTIALLVSTTGSSWTTVQTAATINLGEWVHLAWTRSGTDLTVYINGVSSATGTVSGGLVNNSEALMVGYGNAATTDFPGYISNLRYVIGSVVYTSAFTPPAAPLTNITNTSLLTCQYAGTVRNIGFIDSGPYDHLITRNGNTTQGTFSPFSAPDGRWSNYFDGATATRLTLPSSTDFAFGTGAYTMEAFVFMAVRGANDSVVFDCGTATNSAAVAVTTTGQIALGKFGVGNVITSTAGDVPLNQWVHIAIVRTSTSANDTRIYANGTLVATGTDNNNWTVTTTPGIGGINISGYSFNGYVSNVRIVKGTAITPPSGGPTSPLTAVSGTSLLTCQSNRFVDNSTNNFAITRNGDVKVTPFSPFAPTAAYSPSVNGGSGYFDPTGDYLSISDSSNLASPGSGDFTLAAWIYLPQAISNALNASAFYHLKNDTGTSTTVFIGEITGGGAFNLSTGTALIVGGTAGLVKPGQWNYLVASRVSGTLKTFVNGVEDKSISNSTTYNGSVVQIGAWRYSTSDFSINGYISDFRFVKGSGVTSVTVPTAPLTAIANTSLLCNFTNAGIFDQTGKNNLETVADAQIDTTIKKYGTGSMEFDGTGDQIVVRNDPNFQFGSGNFTIEFFVYFNSVAQGNTPIAFWSTNQLSWSFYIFPSGTLTYYLSSNGTSWNVANGTSIGSVSTGTWYHVALVRNGTTITPYLDGVAGTATNSVTSALHPSTSNLWIGSGFGSDHLNGYIDDLRITKGVARYTTTFTPPTKAFPDL